MRRGATSSVTRTATSRSPRSSRRLGIDISAIGVDERNQLDYGIPPRRIAERGLHLLVGQAISATSPTTSSEYVATVTTIAFNLNLCAAAMTVEGNVAIT